MKLKFGNLDTCVAIKELQKSIVGRRVSNFYDINSKVYMIKLSGDGKKFLMLESGARILLTDFDLPKNRFPSSFSSKCRKHLSNKKIVSISQFGVDRTIDIVFGYEQNSFHLIVEIFDKGNVILTDYKYTIMSLTRPRVTKTGRLATDETFDVTSYKKYERLVDFETFQTMIESSLQPSDLLKKWLARNFVFGSSVVEHVLHLHSIPAKIKGQSVDEAVLKKLYQALQDAEKILLEAYEGKQHDGYLVVHVDKSQSLSKSSKDDAVIMPQEIYESFSPILLSNYSTDTNSEYHLKKFGSFLDALDEYYSKIESHKLEAALIQSRMAHSQKLENIRKDHETRLEALKKLQDDLTKQSAILLNHVESVDALISLINSLLLQKMEWKTIEEYLEELKSKNPSSFLNNVTSFNFEKNEIHLSLDDEKPLLKDEDTKNISKFKSTSKIPISVNISLSCHKNVKIFYEKKRKASEKYERTLCAAQRALKSAEKHLASMMERDQEKHDFVISSKTYWFQKFNWFISSDKLLVIGGKTAVQNELLVKRYMRKQDIFVHAEIQGGSCVVIRMAGKCLPFSQPPIKTLNEASTFAVCFSSCWDSNISCPSYWVYSHQVSKTPPTGEYLTTGGFAIRGNKNFLHPPSLTLGFGIVFVLDEDSAQRYRREDQASSLNSCSDTSTVNQLAEDPEEFPDAQLPIDSLLNNFCNMNVESNSRGLEISESLPGNNSEIFDIIESTKPKTNFSSHKINTSESSQYTPSTSNNEDARGENQKPKALNRGQRAKLKKIKQKYGDQDEEERRIRTEMLHTPEVITKKAIKKMKAEKEKEKKRELNDFKKNRIRDNLKTKNEGTNPPNLAEDEKNQIALLDHDDNEDYDENMDNENLVYYFCSNPTNEDLIEFALVVCAPYQSMMNSMYKVKIIPGKSRKGKACKSAMNIFLINKNAEAIHKKLIRQLKTTDVSMNVPQNINITAPQLLEVKKKIKIQNKEKKLIKNHAK